MPALDDALAKALQSIDSASERLPLGVDMQLYKTVLLCRLEVQYAIALLRLTYGLAARPPPTRGVEPERAICSVTEHLLGARDLFGKGDFEGALGALLCADSALAHLIMRLRREKRPVSGGIGTTRKAEKAGTETGTRTETETETEAEGWAEVSDAGEKKGTARTRASARARGERARAKTGKGERE